MESDKKIMGMKPVDVAVGVLIKPTGEVLMAQRPMGKPYAGYWEFPGGKVDPGETIVAALVREFKEESGVDINPLHAQPWCCCDYVYPHSHVRLHFYLCRTWKGDPLGRTGRIVRIIAVRGANCLRHAHVEY